MADDFPDSFSRELSDVTIELARVDDLARGVGRSLSNALKGAVVDGKSLQGVLGEVSRAFADIALKAALQPLGTLVSGAVESLFTATNPALGGVDAFGKGGLSMPSFFPVGAALSAGNGAPEAPLPQFDGRTAVAGAGGAVNVTFNVTTNDARSFAASETEVSAMLLRAVRRGTRSS